MINTAKKLKINLIVTLLSSAISLTSFLYLTYAWFSFMRANSIEVMTVQMAGDIGYQIKYFTKNYTSLENGSGYLSPDLYLNPSDIITVDNYDTQFLPIEDDPHINGNQTVVIGAKYPGLRFTYALEIDGDFTSDRIVTLSLTNFVAGSSSIFYDTTTSQPINIAKAMNIYATAVDGNGNVTAAANSFVTNLTPTDLFTSTSASGPCNFELATRTLHANEVPADRIIFFFTVDFSDSSDTLYSYASTVGSIQYYTPNTHGSSNVYKNLSFAMTEISVSVS